MDLREAMYHVPNRPSPTTIAMTQGFEIKKTDTQINAHIVEIAMAFVRGLIARWWSQSRRVGPNHGCCNSQLSNRELPFLKQKSAIIIKTVDGIPGTK